jgi:CRISPR type IV-associated protein Csf3
MRIRAYLLDGRVAATEPHLPLDSILAAEWIRKNHPEKFYNPPKPGQKESWIEAELPFERMGEGDKWYWACSFNQSPPVKEYVIHWNRRFDDQLEQYIDFQGKRGKVDPGSGRYKAYRMPMPILIFPGFLEWFAVGDIEAVRELCQGIVAIGKKTSQGIGLIANWDIVHWQDDRSEQYGGKLMRALHTLPPGCSGIVRQYGMRPPYWLRDNQAVVYMPEV